MPNAPKWVNDAISAAQDLRAWPQEGGTCPVLAAGGGMCNCTGACQPKPPGLRPILPSTPIYARRPLCLDASGHRYRLDAVYSTASVCERCGDIQRKS